MSRAILLSDVLSGTGQGIVLGTASDQTPVVLAWRPQILGVQASPVDLTIALQTLVDRALARPDGQSCGVVAVLPALLMAKLTSYDRLVALDGAAATFMADLDAQLEPTVRARAILGVTLPADGSALLTAAAVWSRLTALTGLCQPLLITAGGIAPPRHLGARCCHVALQPTYPAHSTLTADDNGRWTLTPWADQGQPAERLVLTLGRPEPLEVTVGQARPRPAVLLEARG